MDDQSAKAADQPQNRRKHRRVLRPFNGRRAGPLSVAVHIHDLSAGGCLVQSYHDVAAGRRITLEIELPYEGWVTVTGEVRHTRQDYGFAVAFVDVTDDTRDKIERALTRLAEAEGI